MDVSISTLNKKYGVEFAISGRSTTKVLCGTTPEGNKKYKSVTLPKTVTAITSSIRRGLTHTETEINEIKNATE